MVEPFGKLGQDEGKTTGPRPGDGAVLAGQAGGPDMEGTPGDALPDLRGQAAPVASRPGDRLRKVRAILLALAALLLLGFAAAHLPWSH